MDPLIDPAERSVRRRLLVTALKLNHDLKFHRHHPKRLLRRRRGGADATQIIRKNEHDGPAGG